MPTAQAITGVLGTSLDDGFDLSGGVRVLAPGTSKKRAWEKPVKKTRRCTLGELVSTDKFSLIARHVLDKGVLMSEEVIASHGDKFREIDCSKGRFREVGRKIYSRRD